MVLPLNRRSTSRRSTVKNLAFPVVLPLEEGVGEALQAIRQFFNI
jgi:hypothetical protein